jgi:hypothetical protein
MFLRVKTKKYEIMVAPDKEFFLIVHSSFEKAQSEANE